MEIFEKLEKYSLFKGLLLVGALILLVVLFGACLTLIVGLWQNNLGDLFIELFENFKSNWKKLLAVYLVFSFLFALTDSKN